MKKIVLFFDAIMRNYLPDPFVIAVILTYVVYGFAAIFTDSSPLEISTYWGDGLWGLLSFMTQMSLILLSGFVVASSKPVKGALTRLAQLPTNSTQVILTTFFVSSLACWVNWGLGLVVSAFVALEMAKVHKDVSFRLLVAISYMGFVFWHGGLSGSIPLVVSTPDNFSQEWIGSLIPVSETIFSSMNFIIILGLLILLGLMAVFLNKRSDDDVTVVIEESSLKEDIPELKTASERMDYSRLVNFAVLSLGVSYLYALIFQDKFSFNINTVNLFFILIGVFLYPNIKSYLRAVDQGSKKLGPILVQYPLYAGIMGIIVKTGLVNEISSFFVSISTEKTYPVLTFLSAGLVNLFVPSGGGQWAVQAPIVVKGAQALGVPFSKVIMAVAWGDAWTNLAQPFWAIPVLSIAGLGAKDIMGYCFMALLVSGVFISTVLFFF